MDKSNSLSEIIAERTFVLTNINGKREPFFIKIGKPVPDKRLGGDWECSFLINDEAVTTVFGIDSMQALWVAFHYIHKKLENLNSEGESKILWLESDNLGFDPIEIDISVFKDNE